MATSASQQFFERLWYRPTVWWLWLFLPLQLILRGVVYLRRSFYRLGIFSSTKLSVPVVVIGNITVGGTGKTPLAIYILELLQSKGFKPGLVTRGYGGRSEHYPLLVTDKVRSSECGDEPFLIHKRTDATVVVDPVRSRGGQKLIDLGCDIIICDDGLQHYALQRDLEVAVTDASRGLGNGWLMPMGPLREPKHRLSSVDIEITNGLDMLLKPLGIKPLDIQSLDHDAIFDVEVASEVSSAQEKKIHAVAAIGNPRRFFDTLKTLNISATEHVFPDHHQFSADDFKLMDGAIVMTEKDAVKCYDFSDDRMYYLPVSAELGVAKAQQVEQKLLNLLH